jgi:uncharacterized RDD family membrane protein YckC
MAATSDVGGMVDRMVGRQLSEAIADLLVRHHFVERVARQMLATADLESAAVSALEDKRTEQIVKRVLASPAFERMLVEALESQVAADMTERLLSSPETERALERVLTSPAVRAALTQQTASLADETAAGLRTRTRRLDDAAERSANRVRKTPPTEVEASAYAGLASRGLAFAVDAIVVNAAALTAGALLSFAASLFGGLGSGWLVSVLAGTGWALFGATYFVLFWTVTGQTLGMRLMRLRVTGRGGAPPRVGHSLLRFFGLLLAIAPLFAGFLPALFDNRRRALQDFLAGTVVVHTEEPFHPIGVMTGTARTP